MQRYMAAMCLCLVLLAGACRSGGIEINVRYERISGLAVEDPVALQDGRVGAVTDIRYTPEGTYSVQLTLGENFANAFTEHARFFIVDDPNRTGKKMVQMRHVQTGGRLLASGATIDGSVEASNLSRQLHEQIEAGVLLFRQTIDRLGRDIQDFRNSKAYRDMKRSMEDLAEEMARKEKAARQAFKRQWLPRIQRELDDLREKLRQLGREEEMAPLDDQFERLRRI